MMLFPIDLIWVYFLPISDDDFPSLIFKKFSYLGLRFPFILVRLISHILGFFAACFQFFLFLVAFLTYFIFILSFGLGRSIVICCGSLVHFHGFSFPFFLYSNRIIIIISHITDTPPSFIQLH